MLPRLSSAAMRPLACVASSLARRSLMTATAHRTQTAYMASAKAAATMPMSTPKPVKEVGGVNGMDLDRVEMGDFDESLSLGEQAKNQGLVEAFGTYVDIKVSDVLKGKEKYGTALHTVKESDSVRAAMQAMNELQIGAMLVTSDSDPRRIVGILSTRDLVKSVADDNTDPRQCAVKQMMSREPVFTYSDTTALHAMTLMNNAGFRHLPVRDRLTGNTVGVISIGDLVRTMMDVFKEKNEFLEDMVSGKYPA